MALSGKDSPNYKHGHFGNRTYAAWSGAIERCYNKKGKNYKDWGGRGIFMCDEWRNDYRNFLRDMGEKPQGLSLGRIDNDGPYSKENCEWQTQKQQHRNRRGNKLVTINGQTKVLVEWLEIYNISRATYGGRIYGGWSILDAICRPVARKKKHPGY